MRRFQSARTTPRFAARGKREERKGEKKEELDRAQEKADEKAEEIADLERKPERSQIPGRVTDYSIVRADEAEELCRPSSRFGQTARCSSGSRLDLGRDLDRLATMVGIDFQRPLAGAVLFEQVADAGQPWVPTLGLGIWELLGRDQRSYECRQGEVGDREPIADQIATWSQLGSETLASRAALAFGQRDAPLVDPEVSRHTTTDQRIQGTRHDSAPAFQVGGEGTEHQVGVGEHAVKRE